MLAKYPVLARTLVGLVAAYVGFTAAWIVVGLSNTGDAFPQGLARVLVPLLGVAPVASAWLAIRFPSRAARAVLAILAFLAAAFWTFVPAGWWASGPPR